MMKKGSPTGSRKIQKSLNSIHGPPIQQLVAQVSHNGAQWSQNEAHWSQHDAKMIPKCMDQATKSFLKYTSQPATSLSKKGAGGSGRSP